MDNILFIGLGTMGYHMAGHLSQNTNLKLSAYNRTLNTAEQWQKEFNIPILDTLDAKVAEYDIVILCVGRDEDVREIITNDDFGLMTHLQPGGIIIDHTTTSYDLAIEMHTTLAENNIHFIDAPVSGGEAGAINGVLSIMAGGDKEVLKKVSPYIDSYSQAITHIGSSGYGQLAKMVNQICITGILQGLSEGLLFAEKHNLDIQALQEAISGGAAGSWQMSNRLQTMHQREFDFGFMLKWMVKDMGYALSQAKTHDLHLKTATEVLVAYERLCALGHETKDTSALLLNVESTK